MTPRIGLTEHTIVQAAIEIADNAGLEALTLANVAARLHVRSPSLYNHIAGLPELLALMTAHGLERLHDALLAAVSDRAREQAVTALCLAYLEFARQHPGLYALTQRPVAPTGERPAVDYGQRIVDLCANAMKPFGLCPDEHIHAIRGLRSMLHGFAALDKAGGFAIPLDLNASMLFVIRVYVSGLQSVQQGGM